MKHGLRVINFYSPSSTRYTVRSLYTVRSSQAQPLRNWLNSLPFITPIASVHIKSSAFGTCFNLRTVTVQYRGKTVLSLNAMIRKAGK